MSKMSNLDILLNGLIEHDESILEITKEMKSMFSEDPATLPEKSKCHFPSWSFINVNI